MVVIFNYLLIGSSPVCTCVPAMCSCGDMIGRIAKGSLTQWYFYPSDIFPVSGSIFLITDRGTSILASSSSLIVALAFPVTILKFIMILWLKDTHCCLDSISNVSGIGIKFVKHHVNLFCNRAYQGMQKGRSLVVLDMRVPKILGKFAQEYQKVEKSDFLWPLAGAWFAALQRNAGLRCGNEAMLCHASWVHNTCIELITWQKASCSNYSVLENRALWSYN